MKKNSDNNKPKRTMNSPSRKPKIIIPTKDLLKYATKKLKEVKGLRIFGEAKNKISVISFNIESIHPYDLGSILDKMGIAVRTGQHCAQPVMDFYQIPGTVRVSFSFYNTKKEIDFLILAINKAIKMLS